MRLDIIPQLALISRAGHAPGKLQMHAGQLRAHLFDGLEQGQNILDLGDAADKEHEVGIFGRGGGKEIIGHGVIDALPTSLRATRDAPR